MVFPWGARLCEGLLLEVQAAHTYFTPHLHGLYVTSAMYEAWLSPLGLYFLENGDDKSFWFFVCFVSMNVSFIKLTSLQ